MWGFKKALTFYYTAKEEDLSYVKVLGILFPPLDAIPDVMLVIGVIALVR